MQIGFCPNFYSEGITLLWILYYRNICAKYYFCRIIFPHIQSQSGRYCRIAFDEPTILLCNHRLHEETVHGH